MSRMMYRSCSECDESLPHSFWSLTRISCCAIRRAGLPRSDDPPALARILRSSEEAGWRPVSSRSKGDRCGCLMRIHPEFGGSGRVFGIDPLSGLYRSDQARYGFLKRVSRS